VCVWERDYTRSSDWRMDLLTTYSHDSELQVITAPSLISTIHKSPQHRLSLFQPTVSSPDVPWQRLLTVEILQLPVLTLFPAGRRLTTELSSKLVPLITFERGPRRHIPATLPDKCRCAYNRIHSSSIAAFVYVACVRGNRLATGLSVSISCFSFDNSSIYQFYFR
jgi:hypothetical protein